MANLVGKSLEQIEAATREKSREELIGIIYTLASIEPMYSPEQVAAHRSMSKRSILRLVKSGVLKAHKPFTNGVRIPLSTIREWDKNTTLGAEYEETCASNGREHKCVIRARVTQEQRRQFDTLCLTRQLSESALLREVIGQYLEGGK